MTPAELKAAAHEVARALEGENDSPAPDSLRKRFLTVRSALVRRGIYDPILARFDSATVPHASRQQIAEQLERIVASL